MFVVALFLSAAAAVEVPPTPVPAPAKKEGGLSREEIQRPVSARTRDIKSCYERELDKDPNLAGRLVLHWVIDASGAVAAASVTEDTFNKTSIGDCVLRIVRELRFPMPKGGGNVNVTYPFVFTSWGGEEPPTSGIQVAGPLAAALVADVVGARRLPFETCVGPTADIAVVTVRFSIDAGGAVTAASTEASSLKKEGADACIQETMKQAVFPAATGVTNVVYRMIFLPPDAPATKEAAAKKKAKGCAWPW